MKKKIKILFIGSILIDLNNLVHFIRVLDFILELKSNYLTVNTKKKYGYWKKWVIHDLCLQAALLWLYLLVVMVQFKSPSELCTVKIHVVHVMHDLCLQAAYALVLPACGHGAI